MALTDEILKRVSRNPDNVGGELEAYAAESRAKHARFEWARRGDVQVGVVNVYDALPQVKPCRCREIHCTDDVMVAVQYVELPLPDRATQVAYERERILELTRRVNHRGAMSIRRRVEDARVGQGGIKRPVNVVRGRARGGEHAQQPILHGASSQTLDNVKNANAT